MVPGGQQPSFARCPLLQQEPTAALTASQKGVGGVKEKGLKKKSLLPCQPTVLSRDATLESERRERERGHGAAPRSLGKSGKTSLAAGTMKIFGRLEYLLVRRLLQGWLWGESLEGTFPWGSKDCARSTSLAEVTRKQVPLYYRRESKCVWFCFWDGKAVGQGTGLCASSAGKLQSGEIIWH